VNKKTAILNQLMSDAGQRKLDAVLVWKLDKGVPGRRSGGRQGSAKEARSVR